MNQPYHYLAPPDRPYDMEAHKKFTVKPREQVCFNCPLPDCVDDVELGVGKKRKQTCPYYEFNKR